MTYLEVLFGHGSGASRTVRDFIDFLSPLPHWDVVEFIGIHRRHLMSTLLATGWDLVWDAQDTSFGGRTHWTRRCG